MSLLQAQWIHGHSMQIEHPDRISSILRTGHSIQITGKSRTGRSLTVQGGWGGYSPRRVSEEIIKSAIDPG